ncbi:MAG: pyridoxal phosphate-dependent aminotransferase [Halanaeroarchaeum sp.]
MFPRLDYLEWMSRRAGRVPYDLGATDLGSDSETAEIVPQALRDREDPPAGASLENLLAAEYDVQPESVLITAGASHANFLAVATALESAEGASVLVERPAYQPLVETPRGLDARVDRFERGPSGEIDPETIESAASSETALVTVTNRHNPTGHLATDEEVSRLARAAASAGSPLLIDEVYAPYVTAGADGPLGAPSAAGEENAIVTGSLTKFFGLGDLRIGWLVGQPSFVERARQIAYHLPDVAGPSRSLARRALYHADDLAAEKRSRVEANYALLADFVASREDLSGTVHEGSTFAFLEPVGTDASRVVDAAWEEGILLVPGRFYDYASRIRISAAGTPTDVDVSLSRLGQVLTSV